MGYIKKLKNNELVGGTDKTTIYPVTSTEAVFEEITNGNESSFKSQKTINKEQQDELDEHAGRLNTAETEDIKGITINHSETVHTVEEGTNIVNLTIYTAETADDQAIAGLVEQNYNNIIANTNAINAEKNRAEGIEEGLQDQITDLDNGKQVKLSVGSGITLTEDGLISATADPAIGKVVETRPTTDIIEGMIYLVQTSTPGTYKQWVYDGSSWSDKGNVSLGITTDEAIDSTSTNPIQNDAITAQIGYFICTSNGSNTQKNVDAPSYKPSDVGGAFKIKMNNVHTNTTEGATLRFNSDATTEKPLLYNREPVSASNTWEQNEVISVYYDGTSYQASNAMGGGSAVGKKRLRGTPGYLIELNGSIGSTIPSRKSSSDFHYIIYPVNEGDIISITGRGRGSGYNWGLVDSENHLVQRTTSTSLLDNYIMVIPEGVAKIVINACVSGTNAYPNYEWYYAKAGSVGAYEIITEAYLYNGARLMSIGEIYEDNEAVKTSDKQLLRTTKEIVAMDLKTPIRNGDLKVYSTDTYKAQKAVAAYSNTTYEDGAYAIGRPTKYLISIDIASMTISEDADITVTIGEESETITVTPSSSAEDIAHNIVTAFTNIEGWALTDNEDGTLTLKTNIAGATTIAISSETGETGITITSARTAGNTVLCQYNESTDSWNTVTLANYAADSTDIDEVDATKMWQKLSVESLISLATQRDLVPKLYNNYGFNKDGSITQDTLTKELTEWKQLAFGSYTSYSNYWINDDYQWVSRSGAKYRIIPVEYGQSYRFVGGTGGIAQAVWLKSYTTPTGTVTADYVTASKIMIRISSEVVISVPFGANYMYVLYYITKDRSPKYFGIQVSKFDAINDSITEIKENEEWLDEKTDVSVSESFSNYSYYDGIINAENNWLINSSNHSHFAIPITKGDKFVIKANNSNPAVYAWLIENNYTESSPDFSAYSFGRKVLAVGTTSSVLKAPKDAKFLYITRTNNNGAYTPASLTRITNIVATVNRLTDNVTGIDDAYIRCFKQARFTSPTGEKAVSLMHISDIHGDSDACAYLKKVLDKFGKDGLKYIDDFISTGDSPYYYASDGNAHITDNGLNPIYGIGNHDGYDGGSNWDARGKAWDYDTYIGPYISTWGVVQPTGYDDPNSPYYKACYYYKDYAAANLRFIMLDCMHYNDGYRYSNSDQEEWLTSVLADATTLGYHVLIGCHFPADDMLAGDVVIDDRTGKYPSFNRYGLTERVLDERFCMRARDTNGNKLDYSPLTAIVNTWAEDNPGKFVAWLCGHLHQDMMYYPSKYPNVLTIAIDQGGQRRETNQAYRATGNEMACANIVTVKTALNQINIIRVGITKDKYMRNINTFCYNYNSKKVISDETF